MPSKFGETDRLLKFASRIFPINRSLTGEGVRSTLKEIQTLCPSLKIRSVKSGTKVFDWRIPSEWHIEEAYILGPNGLKFCDYSKNNLHLVGYSESIEKEVNLDELNKHLYSLPDQPLAIPYVTSYYHSDWGFCIAEADRRKLQKGIYKIVIKGEKFDGVMNYGEILVKGKSKKEIFLSTYICHPSMANNEVSGITVLTFLAEYLLNIKKTYYTYRIVFIPETIGSLYYIKKHGKKLKNRVVAGFNITCIGDERSYSFLPTRLGNTLSDKLAKHVLAYLDKNYIEYDWKDRGSDERQYCAPGINLPVASIMRSKYGEYPEYHTSLDKLGTVVTQAGLSGGLKALRLITQILESNFYPKANFIGEPQLSKYGLYPKISIKGDYSEARKCLDILTWADGNHSVLEIADKSGYFAPDLLDLILKMQQLQIIDLKRN